MNKNNFFGNFYETSNYYRRISSSEEFWRDITGRCSALFGEKFSSINAAANIINALKKKKKIT